MHVFNLGSLGLLFLKMLFLCLFLFRGLPFFYVIMLNAIPQGLCGSLHCFVFMFLRQDNLNWPVSSLQTHSSASSVPLLSPSSELFISVILLNSKTHIWFIFTTYISLLVLFGGKGFTYFNFLGHGFLQFFEHIYKASLQSLTSLRSGLSQGQFSIGCFFPISLHIL